MDNSLPQLSPKLPMKAFRLAQRALLHTYTARLAGAVRSSSFSFGWQPVARAAIYELAFVSSESSVDTIAPVITSGASVCWHRPGRLGCLLSEWPVHMSGKIAPLLPARRQVMPLGGRLPSVIHRSHPGLDAPGSQVELSWLPHWQKLSPMLGPDHEPGQFGSLHVAVVSAPLLDCNIRAG